MGVLESCKLRREVLEGDLKDSIFAADFGDLIAGNAPEVYGDAATFFRNTHPAKQLCQVVRAVFGQLANSKEPGAVVRLSTAFGGGKTHTLMALWHLAQNIDNPALGTELLPAAGRPKKVTVAPVDCGKAGVPEFAKHGALKVHSLWGEIFYRLGGEKAVKALGKADDPEASPSETQISAAFPAGPVLILLDELVIYMAALSERGQGNLLGFISKLASIVCKRPQAVLVVTDPAEQAAYARLSEKLRDALPGTAAKLDDVLDRKASDFDPIGSEAAQVIIRRLFEKVDPAAAQTASASYHNRYQQVAQDFPGSLPAHAAGSAYAKRIVESYPFHPRLLDTAQERLGALQQFQKSRGVLRLFARILRDTWESKEDVELITAGDLNWSSPRIQADLLSRLQRESFKAAVSADIEKHACDLDGGPRGIHRRAASALLLESLPLQATSGLDKAELALAILRPEEAGPEPGEALDRLVGVCWHTYPMAGGRGWQFRYEPNVIRQIEERVTDIAIEDAKSRVLAEAQGYFTGPSFTLRSWPASARQVPESAELQLALCETEKIAKSVCAYEDDSDPAAPIPRRFQNAIVAVYATAPALDQAIERARRILAAEAIERDQRSGESGKIVREQLQRIKPEFHKQFRLQAYRAFDRIALGGGSSYSVEEQFQASEEQMLQRPQGQASVKKFLDAKQLIYQSGDALDVNRFLKDVLPGATPMADKPGVFTAKAIHERFLAAPGLRLLPDSAVVRQTILKSLAQGKLVVRLRDGRAYDAMGCVEGLDGRRRRVNVSLSPSFALDDSVLVARADSEIAAQWTSEDSEESAAAVSGSLPPPPPSEAMGPVEVSDPGEMVTRAAEEALLKLDLTARRPADADNLLRLAQPLGAEGLALMVNVSGQLKQGGTINFLASGLKPTDQTKPLVAAQTFFNAMSDGATFEAVLELDFGPQGRTGLEEQLRKLTESAPDGVSVRARFDKPLGAKP